MVDPGSFKGRGGLCNKLDGVGGVVTSVGILSNSKAFLKHDENLVNLHCGLNHLHISLHCVFVSCGGTLCQTKGPPAGFAILYTQTRREHPGNSMISIFFLFWGRRMILRHILICRLEWL